MKRGSGWEVIVRAQRRSALLRRLERAYWAGRFGPEVLVRRLRRIGFKDDQALLLLHLADYRKRLRGQMVENMRVLRNMSD